jgi:hypothetical protein
MQLAYRLRIEELLLSRRTRRFARNSLRFSAGARRKKDVNLLMRALFYLTTNTAYTNSFTGFSR